MSVTMLPTLVQPKKIALDIVGKAGDTDFTFSTELLNWNYVEKKEKAKQFSEIYKKIMLSLENWKAELEALTAVSDTSVQALMDSFSDEELKTELKAFFLDNIEGLSGLKIELKDDKTGKVVDTITSLTKEHEYFQAIFDQIWAMDYNITGLCVRFNAFFANFAN
jgi:hypothetical protein